MRSETQEARYKTQDFDIRNFNGFSKRFELYPQRLQVDFSLMAYACRFEGFFKSMPMNLVELSESIYTVQKWERELIKRFDAEIKIIEQKGTMPKEANSRAEFITELVNSILHTVIQEHTLQKSQNFEIDYINNLLTYILVDYFHGDFFSKHHLRWRMNSFEKIGKQTEIPNEDEFGLPIVNVEDEQV